MKMSIKLVYQYMAIFFNFSPTSNHLHSLQVVNCESNSRLVVDEDGNVKSGLKGLIRETRTTKCMEINLRRNKLLLSNNVP